MVTQIEQRGEDFYLKLDRAMLERQNMGPQTPVELSEEDGHIVISTADSARMDDAKFEAALENTVQKYHGMLERLAQ